MLAKFKRVTWYDPEAVAKECPGSVKRYDGWGFGIEFSTEDKDVNPWIGVAFFNGMFAEEVANQLEALAAEIRAKRFPVLDDKEIRGGKEIFPPASL